MSTIPRRDAAFTRAALVARALLVALLLLLGLPVLAHAQACGTAPAKTTRHLGTEYATSRVGDIAAIDTTLWLSSAGAALALPANPLGVLGSGKAAKGRGLLRLAYAEGYMDARSDTVGSTDARYRRAGLHYTVEQELLPMVKRLYACGRVGATYLTTAPSARLPRTVVHVPIELTLAYTYPIGSAVALTPHLTPGLAWFTEKRDARTAPTTDPARNANAGRDISLGIGASIRLGRLVLGGEYRLSDHLAQDAAQLVTTAGIWF